MAVLVLKSDKGKAKDGFIEIFRKFNYIPKGEVFIKPNFSGRPPMIPGENTDPDLLKILIEILLENGAGKVIVGHGALLGTQDKIFPFEKIIKNGGFSFLYNLKGVELLNLDKEKKELVESEGLSFLLPKRLKNFNSYINFAKLKTHMETMVTLSLKNQMGLVSIADRVQMHRTNLEECIAHLGKLIKPTLNIIDGIISMEGNGPHHGRSKKSDLLFAGDDMVELDATVSHLIGVSFEKVYHIYLANKIGAGRYPSREQLEELGDFKLKDFRLALKYEKFGKNIYAWPTTACSRCITAINESGKIIKKHPLRHLEVVKKIFLGNKRINVVIGKADNLVLPKGEKIICIGNCTKRFAEKNGLKTIDKCPPTVKEALEHIKKEIEK